MPGTLKAKPVSWNAQKGLVPTEWQPMWEGLVEGYPFWEGGGGSIHSVSRGRVSTLVDGDNGNVMVWQRGPLGWELHSEGPGIEDNGHTRVDLNPIPELDDAESYTIFIVAKWTQTTLGYLFSAGNTASNSAFSDLRINNTAAGDLQFSFRNDAETLSSNINTGAIGANDGQYHQIALTQRGKSFRELFVDGVSYGTNTAAMGTQTLNTVLLFDQLRGAAFEPEACIAEVALCWIFDVGLPALYIRQWTDDSFGPLRMARRRGVKAAVVGAATPKGPLGHPFHGPFAGPVN